MKKIKLILISFIISSFLFFIIIKSNTNKFSNSFEKKNNSIKYNTSYEKYNSHDAIIKNIDKDTILLLGSSELVSGIDKKEHPRQLLDYKDKSIMQIGGGYYQSLLHGIILGSISSDLNLKTVNLIVSMQWFQTKEGISSEAFESRVSMEHLNYFFENNNISDNLKRQLKYRIDDLCKKNKHIISRVNLMNQKNFFYKILNTLYSYKSTYIQNKKFYKISKNLLNDENDKKFYDIDWTRLKKEAIEAAKKETTNNDFFYR